MLPAAIVVAGSIGWAALALWLDGPTSRPLAGTLVAGFVVAAIAMPIGVRPLRRALVAVLVLWLAVLTWWLWIPARADRDWQPDVARLPSADIHGDVVTIHNVRNFDYRSETDFTERWEDRTFDLSHVRGVDGFFSFWGPTLIAHTIVSWEFDDGPPVAVSIETRKERGEEYSSVRGFFRQYELYYVVADERDVVRLRTNYRGEQVFLYRLRGSPGFARQLLLSYLTRVNELARAPRWYNALTHNCTTSIRAHVLEAQVQQAQVTYPLDWRLLVNGKLDELLYERGQIATSLPLDELRARSDVTARAKAADQDARFSDRIREDLPPRPPSEQ